MTMADRIAIMNGGKIEQLGAPTELYERPRTAFVAGFLGVSNLLGGTVAAPDAVAARRGDDVARRAGSCSTAGRGRVAVGVRPEKIRLGDGEANTLDGHACVETRVRRRLDAVRRRHDGGQRQRVRPEQRARRSAGRAGDDDSQLEPGQPRSSSIHGGSRMTDQLTRRELLARAAPAAPLLTVPGLLAACGGRHEGAAERRHRRRTSSRRRCTSRTGRSTSTTKEDEGHPSLDQFQKKYGVKVNYTEDINDNASFFGEDRGPAVARASRSAATSSS